VLAQLLREVTPTPSAPPPSPGPSCSGNDLCQYIYDQTQIPWLALSSYWVIVKPLTILLIIVIALVVRFLIHRAIDKLVNTTISDNGEPGGGGGFSLLKPLRSRIPTGLVVMSERREQRAKALGSVLRSVASATVFAVGLMLILDQIGFNVGPILASAGVVGLAIGFGAQNLVKDFLAGLFMLLEDQYGVGDVVDVGEVNGTVEAVGLRITTIRDARGVLWYVRNGEILRVGNKSQGWALVIVDVPVGFVSVEQATQVLRDATAELAEDPEFAEDIIAPPEVLGVEQITADGAVLRTTVKTPSDAQWRIGRELRRRLTDALERAGLAAQITASRMFVRPAAQPGATATTSETGQGGPT
jgi:moderate conductance mechanosensitive channel